MAFPGLTLADLSTGPWHNYFGPARPDGSSGCDDSPLAMAVNDRRRAPCR